MLDLTASTSALGKPSHSDLRSGLATAPVLFAAEQQPDLKLLIARRFKHEGDVNRVSEFSLLAIVVRCSSVLQAPHDCAIHDTVCCAIQKMRTPCWK